MHSFTLSAGFCRRRAGHLKHRPAVRPGRQHNRRRRRHHPAAQLSRTDRFGRPPCTARPAAGSRTSPRAAAPTPPAPPPQPEPPSPSPGPTRETTRPPTSLETHAPSALRVGLEAEESKAGEELTLACTRDQTRSRTSGPGADGRRSAFNSSATSESSGVISGSFMGVHRAPPGDEPPW